MSRPEEEGAGLVSIATMEIIVAALFFAFGAVVMFDSYRIGASWASDGPESGYFPFYTGLIICAAALVLLVHGLGGSSDSVGVRRLAALLLQRGLAVLRLNLRGAGAGRALAAGS